MARYTAGSNNCCNNYSFNNGCPTNHSCGSDCQCHPGGGSRKKPTYSARQQSQAPCRKDYIWDGTECVPSFQLMDCPQGYDVCNVCGGNATYDPRTGYTIDGVSGLCDCIGTEQQQDECQELYAEQYGGTIYRCRGTGEYYFEDQYDICMAECFSCPLPSRKGGIVKKQQGRKVNNNRNRFSGRTQNNSKGKPNR